MTSSRTVLITGGNRGIGYAIAERFLREGYQVAVTARSGSGPEGALTVLSIPLGLGAGSALVYGEAVADCIERFQLQLIPSGTTNPERLRLRLIGAMAGDLLPDGLTLTAVQGSHQQTITSQLSTSLELELQGAQDLIEVSLNAPGGEPLQLPPLRLPA
jgi:NAD(P)-dependent dehydrogenase (short-subunit alcohol dehydrogenase family)